MFPFIYRFPVPPVPSVEWRARIAGECYFPEDTSFIHYAVDEFPVRLVSVDSLGSNGKKGDFCKSRLNALDVTLAE